MNTFDDFILYCGIAAVVIMAFIFIRNIVTLTNQDKIINAIFYHNKDLIAQHKFDCLIEYSVMEPYYITLFRLWDWGCENIVPPDVYETIKSYIH